MPGKSFLLHVSHSCYKMHFSVSIWKLNDVSCGWNLFIQGVNRAFPFVASDEADDIIEVQTPILFRLVSL